MTKAPERIWAFLTNDADDPGHMFGSCWTRERDAHAPYVHADYALALVAVENKACAAIVDDDCSRSCQAGSCTNCLAPRIRARTPDDATAALECVKQEVAEQAAKLADEWYHNSGHGSPGDEIRAALITEGQSDA